MKKIMSLAASVLAFTLAAGTVSYAAGGWSQQNGNWYYINSDGMTLTRQMKSISSQKYAFDESGAMLRDTWYYNHEDSKWYYMGGDGAAVRGWLQLGSKWYYFLANCSMEYDGWRTIDGKRYYFDEDGVMKQNGYVGEKYLGNDGINDSRYDIKVRGKVDVEVLEEAGNMTKNIPNWLLKQIFDSGWKIACNAERDDYGTYTHEDYSDEYIRYCDLDSRDLIFFIQPEYVIQGIGLYVDSKFGRPSDTEDFQGAFSAEWYSVSNLFPQDPIIESNKETAFAEVFALYYNEDNDTRQRFREDCPVLCEYMDRFMADVYTRVQAQ